MVSIYSMTELYLYSFIDSFYCGFLLTRNHDIFPMIFKIILNILLLLLLFFV